MSGLHRAGELLVVIITALIIACGGNGPAAPTPTGEPTPGLDVARAEIGLETSLSTTYYPISGLTTEAIFDDIEANGPKDDQGRLGSGLTSVVWGYNWTGDQRRDGTCSIRSMTIRAEMTIELPQHTNESALTMGILENWRTYATGVAEHEQRHVDIYLAGAEDIKNEMEELDPQETCAQLEEQIKDIWAGQQDRINSLQETFHEEEYARLASKRGPLETQINDNRGQLTALQGQIGGLDDKLAVLKKEIDGLELQIDDIDAQVKQINDQFPGEMPPTVRDRLEQLVADGNELLTAYNARVDEHNQALEQRNVLADRYQSLLSTTNDLVDEFNWAR